MRLRYVVIVSSRHRRAGSRPWNLPDWHSSGVTDKDRFSALPLPPLLAGYVFFDVVRTRLLKDLHGDSSGIRGAAWLW